MKLFKIEIGVPCSIDLIKPLNDKIINSSDYLL